MEDEAVDHSDELQRIERRYGSELQILAKFICGQEHADRASSFTLDQETTRRAARLFPAFQSLFLRQEMLHMLIGAFRREIDDLLRLYATAQDMSSGTKSLAEGQHGAYEQHSDNLNLLHRLVLEMVYRENYVPRACGAMLGCGDDVIARVLEEGLACLSDCPIRLKVEKETMS